jgi:hypothetical protein
VVDLSSEQEDAFFDTSRDEEIAQKLFGDLNRGVLGSPDDDRVIMLNEFKEDEKVHEDDHTNTETALSSAGNFLAPTAFATDDDDAPDVVHNYNSGGGTPDQVSDDSNDSGDGVGMS